MLESDEFMEGVKLLPADPETQEWQDEAERLNAMAEAAKKLGVQVKVGAEAPKLKEDGSLADER